MAEAQQNGTVEESADENVDFSRFLFYYRKECGYVVPSGLLKEIPFSAEPVKLSMKTFLDVIKKLRTAQGRDPSMIEAGDSLLHVAVVENMPEYANHLITIEKININSQNIKGRTPLTKAIRMIRLIHRTALIDILIAANCDVNLAESNESTPLHLAVNQGDTKVSLRLIQAGADINAQDCDGDTPLHLAISADAVEIICMLLYFNADANVQCYNGFTPFMNAIYEKNHEIQDILINYVVDFNACAWDPQESTILSLVLNGDGYLLQDVLERGVDSDQTDQTILLQGLLEAVNKKKMDVFRVIWKYFEPDETYQWSVLEQFEINLPIDRDVIIVMQTIMESGKFEPLFVKFNISHLWLLIVSEEVKDIAEQIMLTYVTHGYRLDSKTIALMYDMSGYSKFLEILLHMEIDLKPEPMPYTLCSVLTHIDISMAEFKSKFNQLLIIDSNLPRFINFEPKKVPSLMELSRDACRDHLVNKFKLVRTKDYYFLVKSLPINAVYKDILTFKKCIYETVEMERTVFYRYNQVLINNPRCLLKWDHL